MMHQNTKDRLEKVTNGYKMVTIVQNKEMEEMVWSELSHCFISAGDRTRTDTLFWNEGF